MSKSREASRERGREVKRENSVICNCPWHKKDCGEPKSQCIKIQITYINQRGKANMVGGGSMQYKGKENQILADVEDLKSGYKVLSEVVEFLKLRDK